MTMKRRDPSALRLQTLAFFALTAAIGVGAAYAATAAWGPALMAGALQLLLMRIALAVTGEPTRLVVRHTDKRRS
jgi:hypothetical protein